jgi:guanylate cyclase, other
VQCTERESEMYGLILEGVRQYIIAAHGESVWQKIAEQVHLHDSESFEINCVYDENLVREITAAATDLTGMENFGRFFVSAFIGHYGFDEVLRVLGRHLRDFLNGLDNLHEYMKFKSVLALPNTSSN